MKELIKITLSGILFVLLLNGCPSKTIDIESISQKRAALPKLTGKVKAGILEGITSEKELKIFIYDEFPETIAKFSEYSILMKNGNGTAVVLMCNKAETKALIEDASCTGSIEGSELYKKDLPCIFQLDINEVCNKKDIQ